jgi:6-phosphogluconolactonase (cycloisomerase 2 family)
MDQGKGLLSRSVLKYLIPMVPAVMLIAATINLSCNTSGLPNLVTNSGSATPTSTSTAGTGSVAFVSNFGAGNVASFTRNTSTGVLKRTGTTAAGAKKGPKGLALGPGGGFLYVANKADGNIYEFSVNKTTGALTPLSTPSISNGSGSGPDELAINPAGTFLFVTGFATGLTNGTVTSYSINAGTGQLTKVTGKTTGLTNPFGIAVDSTGSFVFVADQGSGLVFSFKINGNGTLTEINSVNDLLGGGGQPGFIALDPSGTFIYVTDLAAGEVAVLGVSAGALAFGQNVPTFTGPEVPIGIAYSTISSNNFLFAANKGTSTMSSFQVTPNPGNVLPPVTFGTGAGNVNNPTGVVVDPQNAFLYTTNQGAGTVSQFSLSPTCSGAPGPPCFVGSISTGGGSTSAPFDIILAQ